MKTLLKLHFLLLLLLFGYLNGRLYYTPSFVSESGVRVNADVLHQLRYLKTELHAGAGQEMQAIFPEGFLFLNALYSLSWSEVIKALPYSSSLYEDGVVELEWVRDEMQSPIGKRPFDPALPLPYGAFYTGWTNYVEAKRLAVLPPERRNAAEVRAFQQTCAVIDSALQHAPTPFLESYSHAAWPADMVLCIASLAVHDQVFPSRYQQRIQQWVAAVKARTDEHGLIPHTVAAHDGSVVELARGSSQSLMLSLLPEIDPAFAEAQFALYKPLFVAYRFGLPGIREYPKGTGGTGDIVSGPVLLGIGGAASSSNGGLLS